ncbi:MAG: S8 family serine peptidase [Candidatus Methanoperedens sp.]
MVLKNKIILFVKISAALILLLIAFSVFAGAVNNKISPQVESLMLTHDKVPVIIVLKDKPAVPIKSKELTINSMKNHASSSQQQLVDFLKDEKVKGKADKIKQFWIVNAVALNASPGVIKAISIRDDVESIELDSEIHILEDLSLSTQVTQGQIDRATNAIKQINATNAWEIGIDGTGINVSVLDTGIYAAHPDIAGRIIKGYDFVNNDNDPADDDGHGTHVAGTVGGNGAGGTTTGVAPNVSLLIAKVCNSNGWCFNSDIVDAIQWSVENGADIISMSLGDRSRSIPIGSAIDNAVSMGVVVIAAAGNDGLLGAGTINFPGGEKNVIAVGAVDSSDVIAYFSSRGPITVDGEVLTKPDVSAPGVNINSLSYTSSGYSGYTWSGTSMATPHVSGAAALLLQAARQLGTTLSPAQIKSILENTSVDKGLAGKDNNYGAGRIDVFAAIESLVPPPLGFINGTVMDSVDKTGIAGVMISTNTSISTITDAAGFYSLSLTSGTYDITTIFEPTYYTNRTITVSPVINAEVVQDIELLKKPTGNISGTITI